MSDQDYEVGNHLFIHKHPNVICRLCRDNFHRQDVAAKHTHATRHVDDGEANKNVKRFFTTYALTAKGRAILKANN